MNKPMIVAEISANHLGSLKRAIALIDCAAASGADAVKFQTFTPEQMVDADVKILRGPWAGRNALELYRECHTPRAWHAELFARAQELGIAAFSSVFHPEDVAFLEGLECPMYKISSFEITDLNLIAFAARTLKPLIISTGMATQGEIFEATQTAARVVRAERPLGPPPDITLLKCTSAYPARVEDANLASMEEMAAWGMIKVGVSDHTLGYTVPVVATALGASVIEKHLTISRADGGPDAAFSAEPAEFASMVALCRQAAKALGEVRFGPTESELAHILLRRPSGGKRGA